MADQNMLIDVAGLGVETSLATTDKDFMGIAQGADFLPRLQLYGGNSEAVKDEKIPMGHFGLVRSKDNIESLGKEVAVLVIDWRPKAMSIDNEDVVALYDQTSDEFKSIAKKSEEPNSGCMYGPEFLMYIPAVKSFATFFMSSKTARRESPNVKAKMGGAATLQSKLIKTPKYSWHGPQTINCSQAFELPEPEELKEQVQKFKNPSKQQTEAAPTTDRVR